MLPSDVPSDYDVEDAGIDNLLGRQDILVDIRAEFQAAAGIFLFFAGLVPVIFLPMWVLDKLDNEWRSILLSFIGFIALLTGSLYSYIWFRWADKRLKVVQKLIDRISATRKALDIHARGLL